MTKAVRAGYALLLVCGAFIPASRQPLLAQAAKTDSAARTFIDRVTAGAELFRDRATAIAAGYRRVGVDFPFMGEHWVKPSLATADTVDPEHPAMLIYATIADRPTLLGVAFAIALAAGQSPPAIPGVTEAWHDHAGSIDEESAMAEHDPEHAAMHGLRGASSPSSQMRLALLHVWTTVANPAGPFAAENQALPFARLGLVTPAHFSPDAARALSLSCGSDDYAALVLVRRGLSESAAATAVARAHAAVDRVLATRAAPNALSADELAALGAIWSGLLSH